MRKLISHLHVSLDGYIADSKGGMDWIGDGHDDEMWAEVNALLDTVDTVLFGRVTYEGFAAYWPKTATDLAATENDIYFSHWIQRTSKVVFSSTLPTACWRNTQLVKDNVAEEVAVMKAQPGQNLLIFGSNTLASTLLKWGLIDEFHINVFPVILGRGKRYYEGLNDWQRLKLISNKSLRSGVAALQYRVSTGTSK
jgi:dihydrofolate reductase